MDIFEIIKKRRSVRIFQDRLVEKELLEKIIEAGTYAPSNCNIQGWRFIVIDDQKLKDKITENGGALLIKKAPAGILVIYDSRTRNLEYQDYIQSAAAAMQNIFLATIALGLGCCWLNHLPPKKILRKILNIPKNYSPIGYLMIGYPKITPVAPPRKYKLEQLISYNTFGENLATEKISGINLAAEKILIKIYQITPLFIKKVFLNKFIDKYFVKKFEN